MRIVVLGGGGDMGGHVVEDLLTHSGIPAAIGALRLAGRQVTAPGIHAPEDVIEPESFFAELRDRAVEVVEL